jgi:pilus assembly protein Flp/PilA
LQTAPDINRLQEQDMAQDMPQIMAMRIKTFFRDQNGATAIEYGLIAAGISVAIIAVVEGLGTNLNTTFSSVSAAIK